MIRNYIISFDRQKYTPRYTPACQKQIYTLFKPWKWGVLLFLLQLISSCVIKYLHSTERGLSRIRRAQRSFFPSGSSKSTSEQYPDTFPEPVLGLSRVDSISSLTLKQLGLSWLRGGGGKFGVRESVTEQCLRSFGEWRRLWRHRYSYSLIFFLLLFYSFAFASYWQIVPRQDTSPSSAKLFNE